MNTGLRTEVVISIIFLLGAALLFSGFLLVKLTERELLDQQRIGLRQTMVLLSAAFAEQISAESVESASRLASLQPVLTALGLQEDVLGWRLVGSEGEVIVDMSAGSHVGFGGLPGVGVELQSVAEHLQYSSSWNPFNQQHHSYLDLTARLGQEWDMAGFLQVRFSLAALETRVHRAQQLVLAYVLLYGLVLTLFGVYTLNRNIVRPVRRLQQASADVAEGALQAVEVPSGPVEIRDLADSFNRMVKALIGSRAETERHIASLEEANGALRQAQEDLLRSEKMASVGHLSAGMAHEIGNPLSAIVGYLNLLEQDLESRSNRELVTRSLTEAGRIDQRIRELLEFAAPDPVEVEVFDPKVTILEAVDLVRSQGAFGNIDLQDDLPPAVPTVRMNRGRFLQVCINLLLNVRDALPEGGALRLSLKRDGTLSGLVFADDGIGMDATTLHNIFEPFFTTKEPGKGTGLGLSVCQRIVEQAGGRIEVASRPGAGSRFTIWLPASPGA